MSDEGPTRHREQILLRLFFEHGAAERAGDVDAVMATLCDDPYYEFFPLNYRVEGTAAVREFYERMLGADAPGSQTFRITDTSGNLGDLNSPCDVIWIGNDSMVTRDDLLMTDADGRERSLRYLSIFTLKGMKLEGERIYMSQGAADYIRESLGEDFVSLPGVSIID
ncbi:MAG: nuclear transport factor 2 family protein [Sphingobium phenoxybenzoativorans]|uniref:nuclear transport factor 2 family protein n=1 Tax=Sphingobium phenoxybenzoativorans TaxID=1592790 RepID=UPI000871D881|nr:nuclear transport factor 2 family protein [Sphingobium phenoxybenzoativorans]